eukprot:g257.t1
MTAIMTEKEKVILANWGCQHPGCSKKFSQKSDAKRHFLNVHKGRKFSCEICNKPFSSKEMVKAHTQNVHENKRWQCNVCAKVFRWQCNFSKHVCRGKPLIKLHKCPHCRRSYAHVSGLSRHRRNCKRDLNYFPRDYLGKEVSVTLADPYYEKDRSKVDTRRKYVRKRTPITDHKIKKHKNRIVKLLPRGDIEENDGLDMLANALNSASPLVKRKLENKCITSRKKAKRNIEDNHGGSGWSKRYCKKDATAFPTIPKSGQQEILL